jgi:hypothetical protein
MGRGAESLPILGSLYLAYLRVWFLHLLLDSSDQVIVR